MTTKTPKEYSEPQEALYRIQRALVGHVSYLAACESNKTFTEYALYEPILRILMMRGYSVQCEFPCPGILRGKRGGDHKKLDFEASRPGIRFAMEVKWPRTGRMLDVQADHQKLAAFRSHDVGARAFLCVFGRYNHIKRIALYPSAFVEHMKPVYAFFRRTQYGCRILELDQPSKAPAPVVAHP